MARTFLAGDELGNIKSLRYYEKPLPSGSRIELKVLFDGSASGRQKGIQGIVLSPDLAGHRSIVASHADGSVSAFSFSEEGSLNREHDWQEPRLKLGQRFVGIAAREKAVYTCTSNGALRRTWVDDNKGGLQHTTAALPTRLFDWRLSDDCKSFIYGGEEVEVSMWDTERAFASDQPSVGSDTTSQALKKRKRGNDLLLGEIWRAKNISNDFLSLRQPVHNTSITLLSFPTDLLSGTMFGNVRRYDTRAGRRPVSDWKGISKVGGVKVVHKGHNANEVFVADQGCNLFAMDLRNGRILYGYKGLSGAVASVASAPSLLGSVSLDRYFRAHNTKPPPEDGKQRQEERGEVLEKVYMNSIPAVLVWDPESVNTGAQQLSVAKNDIEDENDEDEVWDNMQNIGEAVEQAVQRKEGRKRN